MPRPTSPSPKSTCARGVRSDCYSVASCKVDGGSGWPGRDRRRRADMYGGGYERCRLSGGSAMLAKLARRCEALSLEDRSMSQVSNATSFVRRVMSSLLEYIDESDHAGEPTSVPDFAEW